MKSIIILNYSKIAFYVVLTISMIILSISWLSFEDEIFIIDESIHKALDKLSCEIEFKDFHYKGFCVNSDKAFEFILSYYNETKQREREGKWKLKTDTPEK